MLITQAAVAQGSRGMLCAMPLAIVHSLFPAGEIGGDRDGGRCSREFVAPKGSAIRTNEKGCSHQRDLRLLSRLARSAVDFWSMGFLLRKPFVVHFWGPSY